MQVDRQCGSCSACCYTYEIEEMKKPEHKWCKYALKGRGCSVYSKRLDVCKNFRCSWLNGFEAKDLRPDKSRFVMNFINPDEWSLGTMFHMNEFISGALQEPVVERIIDHFTKENMSIVLTYRNGKKKVIFKLDYWLGLNDAQRIIFKDHSEVVLVP